MVDDDGTEGVDTKFSLDITTSVRFGGGGGRGAA